VKDINLLPDDIKNVPDQLGAEKSTGSSAKVIILVIAVAALLGVSLVLPKVYIATQEARISSLTKDIEDKRYNEVKTVMSDIKIMSEKVAAKYQLVDKIDNENIVMSKILNVVSMSTPQGTTIKNISLDGVLFTVEGTVANPISAAEVLSNLNRTSGINVMSNEISEDEEGYNFEYTFSLEGKTKEGKGGK